MSRVNSKCPRCGSPVEGEKILTGLPEPEFVVQVSPCDSCKKAIQYITYVTAYERTKGFTKGAGLTEDPEGKIRRGQTTVLENPSAWVLEQRKIMKILKLPNASSSKYFSKYCVVCGQAAPNRAQRATFENGTFGYLCLFHSKEHYKWKHAQRQAKYRGKGKVT